MFVRPKDYISIDNNLFFAVVSEFQEDDRALAWLRYLNTDKGMSKLNTEEAAHYIDKNYPEFKFHSSYADINLHGIPLESIGKVYRPDQAVENLLNLNSPDLIQQDAIYIINLLLESGVKQETIGVTGSLMLNTQNDQSDIDMVVYGRENFFKTRKIIQNKIESRALDSLNDSNWQEAYKRRDCALSFEEYKMHESRKYNKCISGSTKVDISMIPENYERFQEAGPYIKIGKNKIVTTVIDDTYTYDFPARFLVNDGEINEVVSYTATYTGQAIVGERIEAAGYIEQGIDGENRLLIGSSREAVGEYIRVII